MKESNEREYVKRTQKDYTLAFKLNLVQEYENSNTSLAAIQRKYGIQGCHTLKRWVEKYGTFDRRYQIPNTMAQTKDQEILALKEKIKLLERQKNRLEKEVETADKKVILFDIMIDIAEEELKVPIRKKF